MCGMNWLLSKQIVILLLSKSDIYMCSKTCKIDEVLELPLSTEFEHTSWSNTIFGYIWLKLAAKRRQMMQSSNMLLYITDEEVDKR